MMKKTLLSLALISSLFASEDDVLLKSQKDILETSKKSAIENAQVNKKSWLSDININLSTSQSQEDIRTDDASVNWNQDIFRFGGIGYQIEYAKAKEAYDILGVDIQKKSLLDTLYKRLLNIKITELEIEQTQLNIKNKQITIEIKQDEYSAGNADISELNDAIMDRNSLKDTLINLNATKKRYINSLKELTDVEHSEIKIPKISMIKKDTYLDKSSTLKQLKLDTNVKNYQTKVTDANYLPKVTTNLKYGHNNIQNSSIDGEYYNYGVNLSIPFSFSETNTRQVSRLEYIKAQQELVQNKRDIAIEYENTITNIQSYQEKKKVALDDIKLYESLLELCESEYKVGYRPLEDVLTLKNTKSIRELDVEINELNIKKELLDLYFDMI